MANRRRAAAPAKKTRKSKRPWWARLLLWTGVTVVSLAVIGAGALAVLYSMVKVPDPNSDFQTNTTFVYYNDGTSQLGSFQVQNRISLAFEDMNPYVVDAIVAAENRTFWTDPGFDPAALMRAAVSLVGPDQAIGGSTITQQYIKVLYLTQEKTMSRKVKELILAVKMGQQLSKEQILEGYLNTVYFGRGAYGIEAASRAYFDKASSKLTLAESVALSAIVNSPGNLDPAKGDKQAADLLERYQYTLNGLVEMGSITEVEKAEIYDELPEFPEVTADSRLGGPKGFLLNMVESELTKIGFTADQIAGGGLKVVTTFDKAAQAAAVKAAQKVTLEAAGGDKKAARKLHAAIASIDNATGGVVALYGGPDFVSNSRNWATTPRGTGSTFKPYALTAALRNGWSLNDTLNGNSFIPEGDTTPVRNAGGRNYGKVSLLRSTTSSINSAYVDLVEQLPAGPTQVAQAATDAGIPQRDDWDLSNRIAMGGSDVSPLYQAAGYSTFANEGVQHDPFVVAEVLDSAGNQLYAADTEGTLTIEQDVAIDVTYALTKVAQDGTGSRAAALGYPVAGKTGTRYYGTGSVLKTVAAWFVGYTRQITTAVMYVKGDEGTDDLGNSFYGSGYPAATWLEYMTSAMEGKERLEFSPATNRVSTHSSKKDDKDKDKGSDKESEAPVTTEPSETATSEPSTEPSETTEPTTAPPSSDPTTTAPAPPTTTAGAAGKGESTPKGAAGSDV